MTRPKIKRRCSRCRVSEDDVRRGSVIVSPTGCAHYGRDDGDTDCGHDATRAGWWWPL